ncbi:hypothetical protein G6F50_017875 [Rhizopus delemar]|uniref:Uncharacterized protein n=1 Tax=Rhizopus delemar TaxID=936053 RepID=A0A9P7BZZ9_9FUNG|nr:hypothetical protein G6F50_017875 [Rhizopus delemar]
MHRLVALPVRLQATGIVQIQAEFLAALLLQRMQRRTRGTHDLYGDVAGRARPGQVTEQRLHAAHRLQPLIAQRRRRLSSRWHRGCHGSEPCAPPRRFHGRRAGSARPWRSSGA